MQVSVIVPVKDAAPWVEDAVRSCLALREVGEVVSVDDGSSDGSFEILERLASADDRVRVFRHPDGANHGVAATRNLGIRASRLPYVAFLDADDVYLPHRFEAARRRFEADPSTDGVYDPVERTFEDAEVERQYLDRGRLVRYAVRQPMPPEDLFRALAKGDRGLFVTPGLVVRRGLLERTGLFPEHLPAGEDTALSLKMALAGRLVAGGAEDAVAWARIHGRNLSEQLWSDYPDLRAALWRDVHAWSRGRSLRESDRALLQRRLIRHTLGAKERGRVPAWLGLLRQDPSLGLRAAWWKALRRREA